MSRPPLHVRVPAKINLHLGVGPRRADGYHDLATVFHAVSLHDELRVMPGPAGVALTVERVAEGHVPTDGANLAVRAAVLLAEDAGLEPAVRLALTKGIPVAGGMAGGSADAAAALVGCAELWDLAPTAERLHAIAAQLGSDVPFALVGGDALGTGRGERLAVLPHPHRRHWVIATASTGLSTPAVYAELDRLRGPAAGTATAADPQTVIDALLDADPVALGAALHNDLQEAALSLRPELAEVLAAGRAAGALGGIVSGSGPTCVFLAADATHAQALAAALTDAAKAQVASVRTAHGPAAGARLVSAA